MQGRMVAALQPENYAAGTSTISFATASVLKPGTYILKMTIGNEQKVYKVMKQ